MIVSFDTGYLDLNNSSTVSDFPAIYAVRNGKSQVKSYPFPRNLKDFGTFSNYFLGAPPNKNSRDFRKLPRFGMTGLVQDTNYIYAGSWNGIYILDKNTLNIKNILTNQLTNDIHGLCLYDNQIISTLTCKDTVVFTSLDGTITDHFTVGRDMVLYKDESLPLTDWRFVSKQFRGSTGHYHFNHLSIKGDSLYATSRNLNCVIEINLNSRTMAKLRPISHMRPSCIHDGILFENDIYFTSINGLIIQCSMEKNIPLTSQGDETFLTNLKMYNRDLAPSYIDLSDSSLLGYEPNWCRGLKISNEYIWVTVNGAYGSKIKFDILKICRRKLSLLEQYTLTEKDIGTNSQIRYMAGFSVI